MTIKNVLSKVGLDGRPQGKGTFGTDHPHRGVGEESPSEPHRVAGWGGCGTLGGETCAKLGELGGHRM